MVAWSKKWFNPNFATWNCFSYSKERHDYCKRLQYDVLALTELHNRQKIIPESKQWITSALSTKFLSGPKEGMFKDPAAGVAIMLSPRMEQHIHSSGFIGSRIAWVRFKGPTCHIFFVAVYIPHKYRSNPSYQDVIDQFDVLLRSVNKNDCIIMVGDLNCQLRKM